MLNKTVTYTDYNDEEITEVVQFNLSKSELSMMQLSRHGGVDTLLEEMIKSKNVPELAKFFKKIILTAYGKKSDDGKRFEKSEELSNEFEQSLAFDTIFMELLEDSTGAKAAEFINGLMPRDIVAKAEELKALEQNKQ